MGIEELLLDRAKKEGKAEGKHDVIENMIIELGLADKQIARIAEVSVDFVAKVRSELKNK